MGKPTRRQSGPESAKLPNSGLFRATALKEEIARDLASAAVKRGWHDFGVYPFNGFAWDDRHQRRRGSTAAAPDIFWSPLGDDDIANVLALARVKEGDRFLDLGCGDGRVMEAALRCGATAAGIEIDPGLVESARRRLEKWGVHARVIENSFHDEVLDADVVFAYLSPASLQRVAGRIARLASGTRVVTARFPIAGWRVDERFEGAYLYRLPIQQTAPVDGKLGWTSWGMLCCLPTHARRLVMAELNHPAGRVHIDVSRQIAEIAEVTVGVHAAQESTTVAVDLIFRARPQGTCVVGKLIAPGLAPFHLVCVYRSEGWGQWPLSAEEGQRLSVELFRIPSG